MALPIDSQNATDEQMRRLESLARMRKRISRLSEIKKSIFVASQRLEKEDALLNEIRAEKRLLEQERLQLLATVEQLDQDIAELSASEDSLQTMRTETSKQLDTLRDDEYAPLKERIDQARQKVGLSRLPNLQEEVEVEMLSYLEERRNRWRESGILQPDAAARSPTGTPPPLSQPSSPSVSARERQGSQSRSIRKRKK
ncbi:uncharacterized protein BJ171DRAFT_43567 [Polychytrium aggregatum]|uniref:uncharacterized protein n=1 Tax=Polychytrium aggregatum TaxID=110093 RepID=UPI0022FF32ED|nr:uncharacterized protein BJ171DRAFT_43567 [Polychytrium aggregatum]KAI9206226.1 hypothetical protein BJ171DRAFT_43567 [Polychytrium aggregatum]